MEPVFGFASGMPDKSYQEDTEDIKTVIADRDEVRRILREEKVAMKCALLLMQFLQSYHDSPHKRHTRQHLPGDFHAYKFSFLLRVPLRQNNI
mgnify:CR=1 FL=1